MTEYKTVKTYTASIYCGRVKRYTGVLVGTDIARKICKEYCDEIGDCVSVTETDFIYTNGSEPGIIVGFINYPRFPIEPTEIRIRALQLAERLMIGMGQIRVSVVFSDETIMLTNTELVPDN